MASRCMLRRERPSLRQSSNVVLFVNPVAGILSRKNGLRFPVLFPETVLCPIRKES